MANYREIVTKAIIGKGKKEFTNHYTMIPEEIPTTILGCWVINHNFSGKLQGEKILVNGTCDINIWYSYDNDTKTLVSKQTISYEELLQVARKKTSTITSNEEVIVRSLRQPSCSKVDIKDGKIEYDITKELGIEILGDTKVRISVDDNEDEWDIITDEKSEEEVMHEIDETVKENFISEEK